MKKGVCPDAYFEIVDQVRQTKNEPHRARFLLELDMATYDNPSFGKEKVLPGVAYIKSHTYKERFGYNSGCWLIVTSGKRRMENLMKQTHEKAVQDSALFYFTTLENLYIGNLLINPLWWQIGRNEPVSLVKPLR